MSPITFARRLFCSHELHIDDIKRHDYETDGHRLVEANCTKCGKRLVALYGLALNAKLTRKTKDQP